MVSCPKCISCEATIVKLRSQIRRMRKPKGKKTLLNKLVSPLQRLERLYDAYAAPPAVRLTGAQQAVRPWLPRPASEPARPSASGGQTRPIVNTSEPPTGAPPMPIRWTGQLQPADPPITLNIGDIWCEYAPPGSLMRGQRFLGYHWGVWSRMWIPDWRDVTVVTYPTNVPMPRVVDRNVWGTRPDLSGAYRFDSELDDWQSARLLIGSPPASREV